MGFFIVPYFAAWIYLKISDKYLMRFLVILLLVFTSNVLFGQIDQQKEKQFKRYISEGNFIEQKGSFETEMYYFGESKIRLRITDFNFDNFEYNTTSLIINRPGYNSVCKLKNPYEVNVLFKNLKLFLNTQLYNETSLSNSKAFYKLIKFDMFELLLISINGEARIDYSDCLDNIVDDKQYMTREYGYLIINKITDQLNRIRNAQAKWNNYLLSNNYPLNFDDSIQIEKSYHVNEVDYRRLLENGIRVVNFDNTSTVKDYLIVAEIDNDLIHGLRENYENFDFIGLYGKAYEVDPVRKEDIIDYIIGVSEKYNSNTVNNLRLTKIKRVFPGSDISQGYNLSFQLIDVLDD